MIKSDNMERPMSLKEEFITYISQENGAHRAMQGHMGKAAGLVRKQEQEWEEGEAEPLLGFQ